MGAQALSAGVGVTATPPGSHACAGTCQRSRQSSSARSPCSARAWALVSASMPLRPCGSELAGGADRLNANCLRANRLSPYFAWVRGRWLSCNAGTPAQGFAALWQSRRRRSGRCRQRWEPAPSPALAPFIQRIHRDTRVQGAGVVVEALQLHTFCAAPALSAFRLKDQSTDATSRLHPAPSRGPAPSPCFSARSISDFISAGRLAKSSLR